MPDFLMPSLGADMEAGTLVKWRVAPGQTVHRGDIVAEVETEKGVIDVECFETGVVAELLVEPGAKVPVGGRLAVIRGAAGPVAAVPAPAAAARPEAPVATPATVVPPTPPPGAPHRARVSPLARRRAEAAGVDLADVTGTGPGGAIQADDIERYVEAHATAPGAPGVAPPAEPGPVPAAADAAPSPAPALAPMRRAIAAAMAKSKREIPHYYLQTRIDMTAALAWLQGENAARSIAERVLPAVVLLKATALALRDVPDLNGHFVDGAVRRAERVHLGFAIALKGGGLVAPAIHDVDTKACPALMAELQELIPRARTGRLRSSEMTDATLTVTSLGDLGPDTVFGVIYPPQIALVGFGRVAEAPWAEGGMVGARPVVSASLAADHRATDGTVGARFLEALGAHLQRPEDL